MTQQPRIVSTCQEARAALTELKASGKRVGLVPTMGALHEGHLSLVAESDRRCDATIVTIFVNPTQFAPTEDLAQYPRTLDSDLNALAAYNVPFVFVPADGEMYPHGFSTYVDPPQVAIPLEGAHRGTHFRGVATVVLKLFNILSADAAFFGQKDYQQALVIQRMTIDLNLAIDVNICPIVREDDGLAMSSRNVYLSAGERSRALALSQSLALAEGAIARGDTHSTSIIEEMRQHLRAAKIDDIDYIAIADCHTLQPVTTIDRRVVVLIAARLGKTRLIDNIVIG